MIRTTTLLAALSLLAAGLHAQQPATVLVDRVFIPGDTVVPRVTLDKESVYRLELNRLGPRVDFTPEFRGTRPPVVVMIQDRGGSAGGPVYEVYPDRNGEYGITVSSDSPVHLILGFEPRTTSERQARLHRPGFSLGLTASAGWHSAYRLDLGDPSSSGLAVEGGLFISQGNWWAVTLGAGSDQRSGFDRGVVWFFVEPRVAILHTRGKTPLEAGLLLRAGFGSSGTAPASDPSLLAIGGYASRALSRSPRGRGWGLTTSFFVGGLSNLKTTGATEARLALGVYVLP